MMEDKIMTCLNTCMCFNCTKTEKGHVNESNPTNEELNYAIIAE